MFQVKRTFSGPAKLFPNAKLSKNHIQHVLDIDTPQKLAQRLGREPQMLGEELIVPGSDDFLRLDQRRKSLLQVRAVTLTRHQGRLEGEIPFHKLAD